MNKNGLSGNPHAEIIQREVMDHDSALINATLALAFEQRTANLLTMQMCRMAEGLSSSHSIAQEIDARLGLEKGK